MENKFTCNTCGGSVLGGVTALSGDGGPAIPEYEPCPSCNQGYVSVGVECEKQPDRCPNKYNCDTCNQHYRPLTSREGIYG